MVTDNELYISGVITGCGEQKIGARVNLAAFYLAGIPLAVFLAFVLHLNGMVRTMSASYGTIK
jgi:Na+-driven multidrug efflux pump